MQYTQLFSINYVHWVRRFIRGAKGLLQISFSSFLQRYSIGFAPGIQILEAQKKEEENNTDTRWPP